MLRYVVLILTFLGSSVALAAPFQEAPCTTVRTNEELSSTLNAKKGSRATLVYARADWAISSVRSLDSFIPSISFVRDIGDLNCVIVDITADGGVPVLKRFNVKGVPFVALLDSEQRVTAKRLGGMTYEAFQDWLDISRQPNSVKP